MVCPCILISIINYLCRVMKKRLPLFLIAIAAVVACSPSSADKTEVKEQQESLEFSVPDTPPQMTKSQISMSDAVLGFGFDTFSKLIAGKSGENALFSPLSLSLSLSLCDLGAAGETEKQLSALLGFSDYSSKEIASYYKTVVGRLLTIDNKVKFGSANGMWIDNGFPVLKSFTNDAVQYFNAQAFNADFSNGESLLKAINDWCKEKTEGLVPEMLKEAPFPPLVIANALYYKAEWGMEFDKEFKEMPFHGVFADAKASFFGKKALFIYNDFNNIQLLSIPYGNGSYDLVVALPASGSTTADALKALGSTEGREFLAEFGISGNGLNGELVEVLLPKFEIKSRYEDVADVLQALGATTPFSAKDADFSNISEKRVYIDRIIQEAVVNVDEKGTEAAAVTLNLMAYSAGPGSEPPVKQFIADRPFVFFIREKGSNAILFMGVKNN